jgi:hypothetical protein
MGEVSPVGARLQCAWNAKVRHGYGMGWVLPRMFLYCINEPVQGGRAGGGFSGALRACLTKSKEAILLQSRDWGQGRAGLYFFKWRIERGCGMNDKGLRSVGFDKYRRACPFVFFYFFHVGLLELSFCSNNVSSAVINLHTTILRGLYHCRKPLLVSPPLFAYVY